MSTQTQSPARINATQDPASSSRAKKLLLKKDTIRRLTRDELREVEGGIRIDPGNGTASRPLVPHPTSYTPASPYSADH